MKSNLLVTNQLGAFYLHAYRSQSSYSLILLFSADMLRWMEGPGHAKGQRWVWVGGVSEWWWENSAGKAVRLEWKGKDLSGKDGTWENRRKLTWQDQRQHGSEKIRNWKEKREVTSSTENNRWEAIMIKGRQDSNRNRLKKVWEWTEEVMKCTVKVYSTGLRVSG